MFAIKKKTFEIVETNKRSNIYCGYYDTLKEAQDVVAAWLNPTDPMRLQKNLRRNPTL